MERERAVGAGISDGRGCGRGSRARRSSALAGGLAALALAACAPVVRDHGYVPTQEDLSEIAVGLDTRASVEDAIGSPGASGILADRGYYYVSQRIAQRGYRAPEVIDREIVAISFDDAGVVSNIERFGLEDGNVVALSRRVTDSNIEGIGFLRQLLGNLGRFDAQSIAGGGPGVPAGPGGVTGP